MKAFLIALCAATSAVFLSGWISSASAIPAVQPGLKYHIGSDAQLYHTQDYYDAEDYGDEYYDDEHEKEERRKRNRNWRRDFSYQDFCYKCYQQCNKGYCPPYCWGWGDQCGRWKWRGKVK